MQDAALYPYWINLLMSAATLLLGGGVLGVLVKSLFDRREQKARTEKIRVEIVGEEIDNYKGFSEAMRAMRQDVAEAEGKVREAKKERAKLEKKIEDLIRQNGAKERERAIAKCAESEAMMKVGELEQENKRLYQQWKQLDDLANAGKK